MALTVRKFRPTSQFILLFLAWVWVIVMSFSNNSNLLSINIIEPFSKLILTLIPINSIGNIVINFFVLLFEAVYLAYIFQKHNLIERNNWIPSIFYLILAGVSGSYALSPPIISNLFILLALDRLFVSYDSHKGIDDIMLSALYISIAGLFYFPSAIFIIGIWLGLLIFRNLNWRYFAASVIGLITPLIYLASWFIFKDQLTSETTLYYSVLKNAFIQMRHEQVESMILFSTTLLFLIMSVFFLSTHQQGKLIKIRKKTSIIITLSIISAVTVFGSYEPMKQSMFALVLLLSGALSVQISEMKSNLLSSLLFWVLVIFYAITNIGIF
jgi:hypothetical protein